MLIVNGVTGTWLFNNKAGESNIGSTMILVINQTICVFKLVRYVARAFCAILMSGPTE